MSAIILPRIHIHCLVAAGFLRLPEMDEKYPFEDFQPMTFALNEDGERIELGTKTADKIGQALADTNLSSILHYDPNPLKQIDEDDIKRYQWPYLEEALTTPAETLNAIDCYEYQSCEHNEWKISLARRYCTALRRHVCTLVPGYREAGWCMLAGRIEERRAIHLL